MHDVPQAQRRQVLKHLVFELVAVNHEQDRRLLRLVRFKQQFRSLDHRVGLAAALRMLYETARALRVEGTRHYPLHRRRLVLTQDELLEFFLLFGKENEVLQ